MRSVNVLDAARTNLLLARLPDSVRRDLLRRADIMDLLLSHRVMEEEQRLEYALFPIEGILSMLRVFPNGTGVEVGMIGCEGFLGIQSVLGIDEQPSAALVQAAGAAIRVRADVLKDVFDREAKLRSVIFPYIHYFLIQAEQIAACNRLHSSCERLARWLLCMHDRVKGDDLQLTQEFLAHMLATRRASMNEAVAELREHGAIAHRRNCITILDRQILQDRACECYQAIAREGIRALSFSPRMLGVRSVVSSFSTPVGETGNCRPDPESAKRVAGAED